MRSHPLFAGRHRVVAHAACPLFLLVAQGLLACGGGATPQATPDGGGGDSATGLRDSGAGKDAATSHDSASPPDSPASADSGNADAAVLGPSPMFGFSTSSTSPSRWPAVTYGMQRFWDTPPLQWPSINTAPGVFDFTNLDADLALALTKGTTEGFYTLARTPPWATSAPSDSMCHYATTPSGGGNGECDAPSDLLADGSGSNATWKAWVTAIATHVNDPAYRKTHAHIRYWEVWNEPDSPEYWAGSIAQLARLVEDANCIITGRGVVHENGDGSATACTAKAIDPTAKIVMPSAHAITAGLAYGQNELYCNASPKGYQLPCPNPPDAIASAVDVVNFHMKPGGQGSSGMMPLPPPETVMQMYQSNIQGVLRPAELAKPLWNGEAQYSEEGWTGAYLDPDMAASFVPRFYLMSWTLGVSGIAWYYEPQGPATAVSSYQQTYGWLEGSSLTVPCSAQGSVWSCTLSKAGKDHLVMWDSAQSCSAGVCTTSSQPVPSGWKTYEDMTVAGTPTPVVGGAVKLGIKPFVFSP